jgi:hypothetical protein
MYPERRKLWNSIRFDHYASGRLSLLNGMFFGGSLSLSYAVETSLKCLAYEFIKNDYQTKFTKKYQNCHDVLELYKELERHGAIDQPNVSKDFLQYISYTFSRYPSQISRTKNLISRNHGSWVQSIGFIEYYDDLMVKLDKCIYNHSKDKSSLILLKALLIDTIQRTCIISGNIGLEQNREFYLSMLSDNEARKTSEKYPNFMSIEIDISTLHFDDSDELEIFEPEKFRLPNKGEQWFLPDDDS